MRLIERDSGMRRVSQPSHTSTFVIAAAAALTAMTAYNVYRFGKLSASTLQPGASLPSMESDFTTSRAAKGRPSFCYMEMWLRRKTSIQVECWT